MKKALVTGAAGFLGGHLVRYLHEMGYRVRGVDKVAPRYGSLAEYCYWQWWDCDLRYRDNAFGAINGMDEIYCLAADMGGMGFIAYNDIVAVDNVRINAHMVEAIAEQAHKDTRVLFTSSACVYPERLQMGESVPGDTLAHEARNAYKARRLRKGLAEKDAWNGKPDTGYGIEKLFSEELYRYLANDTIQVRIARFHNIYGPRGSWNDGREKAPAALCRKVAMARLFQDPTVEIWGDGEQTRSFCYVNDCMEMIYRLMQSDYNEPLNIGTDRLVTINELADIIAGIADVDIVKQHDLSKPQGVRGRNADLTKMREQLQYEPQVSLEDGLRVTYEWIKDQVLSEFRPGHRRRQQS